MGCFHLDFMLIFTFTTFFSQTLLFSWNLIIVTIILLLVISIFLYFYPNNLLLFIPTSFYLIRILFLLTLVFTDLILLNLCFFLNTFIPLLSHDSIHILIILSFIISFFTAPYLIPNSCSSNNNCTIPKTILCWVTFQSIHTIHKAFFLFAYEFIWLFNIL